jgi:hypothetical protein
LTQAALLLFSTKATNFTSKQWLAFEALKAAKGGITKTDYF